MRSETINISLLILMLTGSTAHMVGNSSQEHIACDTIYTTDDIKQTRYESKRAHYTQSKYFLNPD